MTSTPSAPTPRSSTRYQGQSTAIPSTGYCILYSLGFKQHACQDKNYPRLNLEMKWWYFFKLGQFERSLMVWHKAKKMKKSQEVFLPKPFLRRKSYHSTTTDIYLILIHRKETTNCDQYEWQKLWRSCSGPGWDREHNHKQHHNQNSKTKSQSKINDKITIKIQKPNHNQNSTTKSQSKFNAKITRVQL